MTSSPKHILDTSGLVCPEPVMQLHSLIRRIESGDIVVLTATDPSTARDIPKFCEHLEHTLLCVKEETNSKRKYFVYKIQKGR